MRSVLRYLPAHLWHVHLHCSRSIFARFFHGTSFRSSMFKVSNLFAVGEFPSVKSQHNFHPRSRVFVPMTSLRKRGHKAKPLAPWDFRALILPLLERKAWERNCPTQGFFELPLVSGRGCFIASPPPKKWSHSQEKETLLRPADQRKDFDRKLDFESKVGCKKTTRNFKTEWEK